MSFQQQVNNQTALGAAGDRASANPTASVDAGEGALVTGSQGLTVGAFAWVDPVNPRYANSFGSSSVGAPIGFVAREQQALITAFLQESSYVIPGGYQVTLFSAGDFWVVNSGTTATAYGDPVYADYSNGLVGNTIQPGVSFTASIGGVVTGSIGASFTATGVGTNLTTSAQTGYLSPGDIIAGVGIPTGTTIVSQTSGTTGAAGVYVTSVATTISAASATATSKVLNVTGITSGTLQPSDIISGGTIVNGTVITGQTTGSLGNTGTYTLSGSAQSFASGAVTSLSTVMVVTAVASGIIEVGDPVSGVNVTANTVVSGLLTGAGGTGTYKLTKASTAASTGMTGVGGVLVPKFKFSSVGAPGDLVKISSWV